ncbi:uncharacterized protein LOC143038971 isoform X2 [Oratosquilla oratoria]|uniref:uncharacterized protein LOC143038971 isoform X2 n=1 Tax=Oratosquilla oratoria TaxID=337810 RepID=UPI003F762F7D
MYDSTTMATYPIDVTSLGAHVFRRFPLRRSKGVDLWTNYLWTGTAHQRRRRCPRYTTAVTTHEGSRGHPRSPQIRGELRLEAITRLHLFLPYSS